MAAEAVVLLCVCVEWGLTLMLVFCDAVGRINGGFCGGGYMMSFSLCPSGFTGKMFGS